MALSLRTYLLATTACVVLAFSVNSPVLGAQVNGDWSPVARVPGYPVESSAPLLVADKDRTVHAFNSQVVRDTMAIVYREWSVKKGWTDPVDVLLPPKGGLARLQGVYLDDTGVLHVSYFGGNDVSANIYFSSAPASAAGRADAWSKPQSIGPVAGPLTSGTLAGDDKGNLFVVYGGSGSGNGLYAVTSSDAGVSWSQPAIVSLTYSVKGWVWGIQAVLDSQGRLNVVWTVVNDKGLGEGIYYARLEADHKTWSEPVTLATATGMEANSPSIAEHNGELFVIYHNGFPPRRLMVRSSDGGKSWSEPAPPFDAQWVGTYGPAVLLHDSNHVLHMILGNRMSNPEIHGMWHSVWDGGRWTSQEPIVSGPRVVGVAGGEFDPSAPQAVISQGNVLLVTWVTDPGAGRNGVWYSYTTLTSPELPAVPLPAPSPTPVRVGTATPTVMPTPSILPTSIPVPAGDAQSQLGALQLLLRDPRISWAATLVPVLLIIASVVGTSIFRGRHY